MRSKSIMNIFYLSDIPQFAAQDHCNKHVVKMVLETAQLLSTAHRILDGQMDIVERNNRKKKIWHLSDERQDNIYGVTHMNHPSAIWVRENRQHYIWTFNLFSQLCKEYTFRYEKTHKCENLKAFLIKPPINIPVVEWKEPPQCMPEECKVANDAVKAYQNYYIMHKRSFAVWKKRETPKWFIDGVKNAVV